MAEVFFLVALGKITMSSTYIMCSDTIYVFVGKLFLNQSWENTTKHRVLGRVCKNEAPDGLKLRFLKMRLKEKTRVEF